MRCWVRAVRAAGSLIGLATLGACWWHESAVPALVPEDRPAASPIAEGVYCGLEADENGVMIEDDCSRFTWDPDEHRLHVVEIDEDGEPGEEVWLDAAPISHGLTLLQVVNSENEGAALHYQLFATLARPEGLVMTPLPDGEVRNAIAEEEGLTLEPGDVDDEGRVVLSGDPAAVRRMVERSAEAWFMSSAPPEIDRFAAYDPDAPDDFIAPRYTIRIDALDPDLDDVAAAEAALATLRDALETAARS